MRILNGRLARLSAARLALCVLLALAATGGLSAASSACGAATHHVIVDLAYDAVDKQAYPTLGLMIGAFPDAADGGAIFPDYGYGYLLCADAACQQYYRDMAEDAHGAAFIKAYLEQVRGLFRQPRSDDDRRTVMFLFGLIAHREADNPWHFGVGSAAGFLSEAMRIDGNNESTVEIGSDIFVSNDYSEGSYSDTWFFPMDAIRAAYRAIGHEVTDTSLTIGLVQLAALHSSTKSIAWASEWAYKLDLPWTHDNLLSYPVGGMQDGANHTALAWQQAWDELSTWRYFMPSIGRGSATSPAAEMQDMANPTANAGHQTGDESRPTGHSGQPAPRLMLLGQQLLKEGAVRVHSRLENGNLFIDRVEIVDQQRVDQLVREMLPELPAPSSR